MATYNLLVRDSDDVVLDWNHAGKLANPAAGETLFEAVTIGEDPQLGGTYDGATYTAPTPPDYFEPEDAGTPIENGAAVALAADGVSTLVVTIQKKNGADDADKVGLDETIKVLPQSVIKIDKMEVTLDTSDGAEDVTIGPFDAGWMGCVNITLIDDAGTLARRWFILEVS